jgi:hypothetical protein
LQKPALMVYTDGSILGEERAVGVYCEAKGFERRCKIEKDVPISSAELKAIEIATNFIFRQYEQKAVILTDSRTACQIPETDTHTEDHTKRTKTNNDKMDSSTRWVREERRS